MGNWLKIYGNRRVLSLVGLGFSSGLPLALTASTLQAWLMTEKVDLSIIGIFSLVGLPYALKVFWAPLMDRFSPPWLGRRRGWIISIQLLLAVAILCSRSCSPGFFSRPGGFCRHGHGFSQRQPGYRDRRLQG